MSQQWQDLKGEAEKQKACGGAALDDFWTRWWELRTILGAHQMGCFRPSQPLYCFETAASVSRQSEHLAAPVDEGHQPPRNLPSQVPQSGWKSLSGKLSTLPQWHQDKDTSAFWCGDDIMYRKSWGYKKQNFHVIWKPTVMPGGKER